MPHTLAVPETLDRCKTAVAIKTRIEAIKRGEEAKGKGI